MAENTMKNKDMDLEMRISIQLSICENTLLRDIAKEIGKDSTTVSKEIQKHRYSKIVMREGSKVNRCANKKLCRDTLLLWCENGTKQS